MTTARALIAPPSVTNTFHCISRCVRRSWLCGKDPYDGRDYEHRRGWIQARILELAEIFAVGIQGCAVMSPAVINATVDLVIHVNPALTEKWTDNEVAERGVALHCPGKFTEAMRLARVSACFGLARQPGQTGRAAHQAGFAQLLHAGTELLKDESAVASAMVYVDLNPVRAGMATDLDSSDHTSVQQRIRLIKKNRRAAAFTLKPIAGLCDQSLLNMTEAAYIKLVDWTGRRMHPDKFGKITGETPSVLRETEGSGAGTPAVAGANPRHREHLLARDWQRRLADGAGRRSWPEVAARDTRGYRA